MRTFAAAIVALLVLVASPVTAGPVDPTLSVTPGTAAVADTSDRLDELWDLAASGSVSGAVRAAARLGELHPKAVSAPTASAPPGVPAAISAPVGKILAAIEAGGRISMAAVSPEARELFDRFSAELAKPNATTLAHRLAQMKPEIERAVDSDALATASLLITRAVDQALPQLLAYAATLPTNSTSVDGCDVVEQAPALCIGNTAANTISADYGLVLDLGGNDVHANGGGAGLPFTNGLPVAIELDLGGDDRYVGKAPRTGTPVGTHAVQGVGQTGGIGMLVDVAGNDAYEATIEPMPQPVLGRSWPIYGQAWSLAGAGILADLGGDDTYSMINRNVTDFAWAQGRGYAATGGLSVLLDTSGNDSHLIEGAAGSWVDAQGRVHGGDGQAMGYGFGSSGPGLMADLAGNDTMILRGIGGRIADDETRPIIQPSTTHGYGFGLGIAGSGALLLGPGNAALRIDATAHAPKANGSFVTGYGAGVLGTGAVLDVGGDDSYDAIGTLRSERVTRIDDSCKCAGVKSDAQAGTGVNMTVHGAGSSGVGVLHDLAGNDRYRAIASSTSRHDVVDQRTRTFPPEGPDDPSAIDVSAGAGHASISGQGSGPAGTLFLAFGATVPQPAVGLLKDDGGDDVYEADARTNASVHVETEVPDAAVITRIVPAQSRAWVQGSGVGSPFADQGMPFGSGSLVDAGGADRYSSSTSTFAVAEPSSDSPIDGTVVSSAQGSALAGGAGAVLDLGQETDVFALTPNDQACEGVRGQGLWRDCGPGAAFGYNPS